MFFLLLFFILRSSSEISVDLIFDNKGCDQWQEGTTSSPVFYEKDGKGYIVGASYHQLYCINADSGDQIWRVQTLDGYEDPIFDPELSERFETGIVLAEDVYEDGDVVFFVGAANAELTAWGLDGSLLKRTTVDDDVVDSLGSTGSRITNVAAFFLDNDDWRIVVGLPTTGMQDGVGKYPNTYLLDKNFNLKWSRPIHGSDESKNTMGIFNFNHGFGDLSGDGNINIIAPSDDYSVSVWDLDGNQEIIADTTQFPNSNGWWSNVVFDKDADAEVLGWSGATSGLKPFFAHGISSVLNIDDEPVVAVTGLYANGFSRRQGSDRYDHNTLFLLHADRQRFVNLEKGWDWTESYEGCSDYSYDSNMPNSITAMFSYADLNGNGYPEIVLSCTDNQVHAIGLDKKNIDGFPFSLGDNIRASEVSMFVMEGEDCPYLVFTTYTSSSAYRTYNGYLYILDCKGNTIVKKELQSPAGSNTLSGSISGVTLFHKEYDESTNLFAVIQTIRSGLVMYEIQDTKDAIILWQTQRGNFQRTGIPLNVIIDDNDDDIDDHSDDEDDHSDDEDDHSDDEDDHSDDEEDHKDEKDDQSDDDEDDDIGKSSSVIFCIITLLGVFSLFF